MLLSVVSILIVAQSSSEVPEGLMNNPVLMNTIQSFKEAFLASNTSVSRVKGFQHVVFNTSINRNY